MGNGIIIRVPQGMELSFELLKALGARFKDYRLEVYNQEPDHQRSITRRIESMHQAFLFLFDAYPAPKQEAPFTKELALSCIAGIKASVLAKINPLVNDSELGLLAKARPIKGLDDLEKELKAFTTTVIDMVSILWGEPSMTATCLLNEAEQYVLMSRGRESLVTLMPIKSAPDGKEAGKSEYILQVDMALPAYSDELLDELRQIKRDNYPKTPPWFSLLANAEYHYMQAYFCNLKNADLSCIEDFNQFLHYWNNTKKQINPIQNDLDLIAKDDGSSPAWFEKLPTHHQEMLRVLVKSTTAVIEIDKKLSDFKKMIKRKEYSDTLAQLIRIPQWYWVLPLHQQCFLGHALKNKNTVEEAVASPPSRLRTIPLPANFCKHTLEKIDTNYNISPFYAPKYRSSHVSSRDALAWPEAVQLRHVISNLLKVLEYAKDEQFVVLQTLITPMSVPVISKWTPDYQLDQLVRIAIEKIKEQLMVYYINHSLNYGQYLPNVAINDSTPYLADFLTEVKKLKNIERLVEAYKEVLDTSLGSSTVLDIYRELFLCRELFLSSLEQIIVLGAEGYSYGSCVSGKDRKAVEIIHTDAMILYYDRYKEWPQFSDTSDFPQKRANFVSIVADVYITRHHHEHAGQNAPGSEGIKTPDMYFPWDIVAEVNRRLGPNSIDNDDLIASLNEVKKISTGAVLIDKISSKHLTYCQLITWKLGEPACTRLYTSLHALVNESNLFTHKEWIPSMFKPVLPYGIGKIRELMQDPAAGSNNVMRFAGILAIVTSRPEDDKSRTVATKLIYKNIRKIFDLLVNEIDAADEINEIVTAWDELFAASKGAKTVKTETGELIGVRP